MIGKIAGLYKQSVQGLQREVWILSIAMFINRSGSVVILFTTLYLTNELNFDLVKAGSAMSFYGIGSVLGSYAGGWLTDKMSHSKVMLFSLVSSGLILLLLLIATQYWMIAAILFAYAFTADIFRPANASAISLYSSAANRTRSVSLMRLAINLGFSVGPAVGGFIAIHLGYHALFVLDTLTGFAAAGLLAWKLPKHRHVAKINVASDSKNKIPTPIANAKTLSAYKDVTYLFFILLVAAYAMLFFQAFSSIPQYFSKVCGYTEDTIGLLIALNGLLVVLIELPLMTILEKKSTSSFRYIVWGVLFLPVGYLALAFGQGYMIAALAYTLLFTVSEMFTMPFMMNFSLSRPTNDRKGQYAALYSIAYGLALTAAPVVGLWLVDKLGFMYTFYCFIVACLFIALGFNFFRKLMMQSADSNAETK